MTKRIAFLFPFSIVLLLIWSRAFGQNFRFAKYKDAAQSITRLRVASAAVLPEKWKKELNWRRTEKLVTQAAVDGGALLVVAPEGVLEGYVINEVNREQNPEVKQKLIQDFLSLGEPMDGQYIKKACALSEKLGIYFAFGFLERNERGLFNTAILIDPQGDIIGKYSKTHFAQGYQINPEFYRPGDEYPVFDTPFGKVGILICYDRQLPEPARILALKGAQVLLVPSYGSYTDPNGWNTALMRTRAYENRCPVVFCNPFQSLLIGANGDLKAIGNAGEVAYYEIDTSPDRYKDRFANRRPATYQEILGNGHANGIP